ncbi:hypothetical protein pb186bvf_004612 [Paramecium bursaria]
MLTKFSKKKLQQLLIKLDEAESHSEALRQILCQQEDFEPYQVFKQIAKLGFLDLEEIHNLLKKNAIIVTDKQIQPIISWYSSKCDDKLNYADFMNLVLPNKNLKLRQMVTQKPTFNTQLSYQVEYGLCRLLFKEVQIFEDLNNYKIDLVSQPDFDYRIAFQTIDTFNNKILQQDMIEIFVQQAGDGILRRLDQNRDQKVDIEDFRMALEPSYEIQTQHKPKKPIVIETKNNFPNRRAKESINKHISRTKSQATPKSTQIQDIEYLVEGLRIMAELEWENEVCRENLCFLQYDILELFNLFDADKSGRLTPGDIKATLAEFEIFPTQQQLFLWMKRHDLDRDGKWNLKEFYSAFKAENYQKISQRELDCGNQIENEVAIEAVRQKLSQRPNFNLKQLFSVITQRQVILENELRCLLENYGVILDDRKRNLLIKRFDKNGQNFISYSDFLSEFYPRNIK